MKLRKIVPLFLTASLLFTAVPNVFAQSGAELPAQDETGPSTPEETNPDPETPEVPEESQSSEPPVETPPAPEPEQPYNPPTQPSQPYYPPAQPYYPPVEYEEDETPVVAPDELESAEVVEDPEADETEEEAAEPSLLDGPYVAFAANVFLTEEEADSFIQMIAEDPEAGDRFVTEKIENDNGSFIVTVEYAEDAEIEGRSILFYVETAYETEEEAREYMTEHLLKYPDVFYDAEVITINDQFSVVFAIQAQAETLAITYDLETLEMEYLAPRREYTYSVYADENGEFDDQIQPAVEEAFPGEFTFESETVSDTEVAVTMTPVENPDEESSSESSSTDEIESSDEEA